MNTEQLARIVIEKLRPDMHDYIGEESYYWEYDLELDRIDFMLSFGINGLVEHLNGTMHSLVSSSPKHHCATDVAETLLSLCPEEFTGKFVFN